MTSIAEPVALRAATPADVPALAALMRSYMRETYNDDWHGSADAMARDGFGRDFEMHVAAKGGDLVGMVAWRKAYDLHHCTVGVEVIDMFVAPPGPRQRHRSAPGLRRRRRGAPPRRQVPQGPGRRRPSVRRLYERVAITFLAVECIVAGRALRTLAQLAHAGAQALARSLPEKSWNHEA